MTIYKCYSCGFYGQNKKQCNNCGVTNRLVESSDSEILSHIGNKISKILKAMEKNKK